MSGTSNYTTTTNQTLTGIGITCANFAPAGTNYSFTITAGTQSARLESGNRGGIVLACLGAPCLLMLGLLPASKRLRKSLVGGLVALALGVLLMQTTGCSSGGFDRAGTSSAATDGNYLLDITNAQGATVAEVPLVIEN
jgi:hypothetical protein